MTYKFDEVVDRYDTFCTQWDYIEDRFGEKNLLPFSISDMDFVSPKEVIDVAVNRLNHGVFGYTRWNHSAFKQSICGWFNTRFGSEMKEEWVLYSPTVIYSISKLIHVMSETGDGVIVQTPAYDAFFKVIEDNERTVVRNQLVKVNHKYVIDFVDLEEKAKNPKNSVMLLCNPQNPTGRVFTAEELGRIVAICQKHNVFIISDEIHMDVVHKGNKHLPITDVAGDYLDGVAICSSATKTFNTPGLLSSYLLIPNEKIRESFLVVLKNMDGLSSPSALGMLSTMEAYNSCGYWVDELNDYLFENMKLVETFIKANVPQLSFTMPEATYLAWIDTSNLPYSSEELQEALVHHAKVAIMPGVTYGSDQYIRMNVGGPRSKVEEGLNRLKLAVDYLNSK